MSEFFGQEIQPLVISSPVGAVVDYAGDAAPTDWMLCQGQALNKSAYAALFAVVGVKYGSGDGSGSQFNLPDCRDRVSVGVSATKTIASKAGAETVALSTAEMPSHTHTTDAAGAHQHSFSYHSAGDSVSGAANGMYDPNISAPNSSYPTSSAGSHTHTAQATGGGGAHTNMQPYIALNKIIKVV